ncbi:MAG TPA: hypothetical protein VKI43_15705 [Vicinamibacterales bacterium]|nr:hypothetical protein [Vicinamibacterales bacterium]
MTPDPRRDVMVYQVAMVDALGGASIGDRWTVWLGTESEGSFDSEADAIMLAVQLAEDNGRPAWLVNDGGATIAL